MNTFNYDSASEVEANETALRDDAKRNLYLIEYYTVSPTGVRGWEIRFAWVYAKSHSVARNAAKLRLKDFDEVITCEEQARITKLVGVPSVAVIDDYE